MPEEKKKLGNTKEEYEKALASDDPTTNKVDLESLAKEAMKKFKSL